MPITRHFIDVGSRRVHYRKAGSGPPLLMAHQSPRSSAEYVPLMERWSQHFTCIAPDTPGFGQSDKLPNPNADITDYGRALLELLDAMKLDRVPAYGFHSGGVIVLQAAKQQPDRFTAVAVGGYSKWNEAESKAFAAAYLPAFQPQPFGEHLAWLWHRILEQTWFFPWYETTNDVRLSAPYDDPVKVDHVVREMLDSGDAYRTGYGAVIRADKEFPAPDAPTPPVLIVAADADPLQAHMKRYAPLPPTWEARPVRDATALEDAALEHLKQHQVAATATIPEAPDEGFVHVRAAGFDGLIHWRGTRGAGTLLLHAPGRSIELLAIDDAVAIDLPGHGISDPWPSQVSPTLDDWAAVVVEAAGQVAAADAVVTGEGLSALLALAVAARGKMAGVSAIDAHIPQPADADRWIAQALPDLEPDRFGAYLHRAWGMARAELFFWPWFEAKRENAIPFDQADLAPEQLARVHRSAIRARAGKALVEALLTSDRAALVAAAPAIGSWDMAGWARDRADVWRPAQLA